MSNYGPSGGPYRDQPQDPWQGHPPQDSYAQPADPWGDQDTWNESAATTQPAVPGSPGTNHHPGGYGSQHGYGAQQGYGGHGQSPAYGHAEGYPQEHARGSTNEPTYQDHRPPGGYQAEYPRSAPRPVPPQPAPPPVWSEPVPQPPRRRPSTGMVVLLGVLVLVAISGTGVGLYLLKNKDDQGNNTTLPSTAPTASASSQPDAEGSEQPSAADGSPTDVRFAAKGQCLVNKGTTKKPVMQIAACGAGTYEVLARFNGTKDYAGKCGDGKVPGYQYYYFYDSEIDDWDFVLCLKKR